MTFLPEGCTFDRECNQIGWEMLPYVNDFANVLINTTDDSYYNKGLQDAIGIYPGEEWCNPELPHCKWHVEAAIGLVDFVNLADKVYRLIKNAK